MKNSQHFKELLRGANQRATPGRIALLETLEKSTRPLSTRGIAEKLPRSLDQATLYRALEALTGAGIVRRVDFQHDHAHYELASGKTHHHHLICEKCDTVEDIEECSAEKLGAMLLKKSKKFGSIKNHSLEFYGICNSCIKNSL